MSRKSTVSASRLGREHTLDKVSRLEFSAVTKRAAWERAGGRCEGQLRTVAECPDGTFTGSDFPCWAPIDVGGFHYDHIDNVWTSQNNSLENCQVLCIACHKAKTKRDVKQIAKTKRIIKKAAGLKISRHPLPFGRGSLLKRKLNGTIAR